MSFVVRDLGTMPYREAWDVQIELNEAVQRGGEDTLLFVRHPKVLTLGANFHDENLLAPVSEIEARGVEVVRTDRGGDVTYHGPGQLVIYPIFDISKHGRDLHKWMRDLEETMLLTLSTLGLNGRRFAPHTGAWIGDRKVAAIGVKVRRWVNLHGIALNCDVDLADFDFIIPCGIQGYGVTSLSEELGRRVTVNEVIPIVTAAFRQIFDATGENVV